MNWKKVPLKLVGTYINGRAFKPSEWENAGKPIIRIQNLNNPDSNYNYSSVTFEDKYIVQNNDILVAWSASLGVYIWQGDDAWLNQHIFKVIPNTELVSKRFLYYALKEAITELYKKAHGSGIVHVTKPVFEAHEIPLPPLSEQARIVTWLDAQLGRVKALQARAARIPVILKQFRQRVLADAVSGKLTADWRTSDEADVYKTIPFHELIHEMKNGISTKPSIDPPGSKILRISAIRPGKLDLSDFRYLTAPDTKSIAKYYLQEEDLLFTRYNGSIEFLGICARVNRIDEQIVYPDKLIRVRVDNQKLSSNYCEIYFQSELARNQIINSVKSSAGQNGISGNDLKLINITLPPLAEQHEIVRRVERLLGLADAVEAHFAGVQAKLDKLPQVLLAKAFKGEV